MIPQPSHSLNSTHAAHTVHPGSPDTKEWSYTALHNSIPPSPAGHQCTNCDLCRLTVVNHLNDDDSIIDHVRVYVSTQDTVEDVKCKISQLRGVEMEAVKLFDFWGKELDEKMSLKEAKLHDLSVLHCYISVCSREGSIVEELPPECSPLHEPCEDEEEAAEEYVKRKPHHRQRLVIGIILLVIGFCVVAVILLETIYTNDALPNVQQAIVIDAGSSATKPHLYKWQGIPDDPVNNLMETPTKCKKAPGMANEQLSTIGTSILECLSNGSFLSAMERIPREKVHVFLGATAGLRMLNHREPLKSDALLKAMRQRLSSTRFNVVPEEEKIRIITGSEEAFYAWITVNYVKNVFKQESVDGNIGQTYGSLDLGGASAQVAFALQPSEVGDAAQSSSISDTKNLTLFGRHYQVYAKSFLCFGKDQAHWRYLASLVRMNNFSTVVNNPCRIKGSKNFFSAVDIFRAPCVSGSLANHIFGMQISLPSTIPWNTSFTFVGTSEPDRCESLVNSLLSKSACQGTACSSFDLFKPLKRRHVYLAFSGYYYVSEGIGLAPNQTYANYRQRLVNFCLSPTQMRNKYTEWYCMEGFYIIALLSHYGFEPSDWNNIRFVDKEGNFSIGWTLGFILYQILHLKDQTSNQLLSRGLLVVVIVLCGAFLICAILLVYFITRRRPLFVNRRGLTNPCWHKLLPPT